MLQSQSNNVSQRILNINFQFTIAKWYLDNWQHTVAENCLASENQWASIDEKKLEEEEEEEELALK